MRERVHWIVAMAIGLLTLALYLRVAEFGYVNYDDQNYVSENPRIAHGLTIDNIKWSFTTFELANWHPLTWLSYMLDTALFGPHQAGAAHLVNVLLHAMNASLLFAVLRRLTNAMWRSALVAALFAVHPLHVESVAWIAERKDVLSTFFGLGSTWFYISFAQRHRFRDMALASACLALSLMAKPMLVTLPVLFLILDWWPLRRLQTPRDLVRLALEKCPLIVLCAASCVVTVIAQHAGGALRDFVHVTAPSRIENAVVSYAMYLWQTIWPVGLVMFYPYPRSQPAWIVALSTVVFVAIWIIAGTLRNSRPHLLMGWLWYVISLLPVIGLVQVGSQARADRYTYIPLIGIFIMFTWSLPASQRAARRASIVSAVIALCALAILQQQQLNHWRNDRALAQHALQVNQNNEVAHLIMGNVMLDDGDFSAAAIHFETAARLQPNWADAHNNLGNAVAYLGDAPRALAAYQRAIEIQPNLADAHYNLGVLWHAMDDFNQAASELQTAIDLNPQHQPALVQLGAVLRDLGRLDEAVTHLETAVALQPNDPIALVNLADVQARLGRLDAARSNFGRAAQLAAELGHDELRKQALDRLAELNSN